MYDFWLDACSLIRASREAYRFGTVPKFWDYLEQKAKELTVVSSSLVLKELEDGCSDKQPDDLLIWARNHGSVLFITPTPLVQNAFSEIAESVNTNVQYAPQWIQDFLKGADPWVIAHARVQGGRVVTFEKKVPPNSSKVKIPDVADKFGIKCVSLWDMLTELKVQL